MKDDRTSDLLRNAFGIKTMSKERKVRFSVSMRTTTVEILEKYVARLARDMKMKRCEVIEWMFVYLVETAEEINSKEKQDENY